MIENTKRTARWDRMLIGLCLLWMSACGRQKAEPAQTTAGVGPRLQVSSEPRVHNRRVREPAVAGGFYPADKASLAKTIDDMLGQAKARNLKGLRALVSPHAGYQYSGPIAASGFKQLVGLDFQRIVVMGPSHHVLFSGVALPDVDALRTPLGDIMISPWARELAHQSPFVVDSTPHAREHSVEVELPFLQRALGQFEVVPLVFGEVDEQLVARRLAAGLDAKTLIVASSDLSHYYSYDKAQALDRATVEAIVHLDTAAMARREACGRSPIMALLHIARERGWKAELLDARNSGDTAGDHSRVVGYASIAFFEGKP